MVRPDHLRRGDHLQHDSSHGPLRIQCHDALVTVVYHALLQDHPGVLREQGIASSDRSHSGDIYLPDFSLGCLVYFDFSVRCTTQPAFISSAASQAGVAAAAGQVDYRKAEFDNVRSCKIHT